MKLSEKLLERLKADPQFDVPDDAVIERTYRGPYGIASGVWAWYLRSDRIIGFGSEDTMAECVRAPRLSHFVDRSRSVNVCAHEAIHVCAERKKK